MQANDAGLTEGVQWYLPGVAAFDHIFDHNSTYRDASLAFDMRGTLGVRSCPPRTGTSVRPPFPLLVPCSQASLLRNTLDVVQAKFMTERDK